MRDLARCFLPSIEKKEHLIFASKNSGRPVVLTVSFSVSRKVTPALPDSSLSPLYSPLALSLPTGTLAGLVSPLVALIFPIFPLGPIILLFTTFNPPTIYRRTTIAATDDSYLPGLGLLNNRPRFLPPSPSPRTLACIPATRPLPFPPDLAWLPCHFAAGPNTTPLQLIRRAPRLRPTSGF